LESVAAIIVGLSEIWLERNGFIAAGERFLKALELFESNAAIRVSLSIIWF